jgi:hypothetical protein
MTTNVRFGSKANICSATGHVRFTPNSDRESGCSQEVMSALHLKADMCGANTDVRFGPEADMANFTWIASASCVSAAKDCLA